MPFAGIAYFGYTGPIDTTATNKICAALSAATFNPLVKSAYLTFSSFGGGTGDGVFLYNHIRSLPIPLTIHATGDVQSIALIVYVGAKERLCSEHTLFMAHPADIQVKNAFANLEQARSLVDRTLAEDDRIHSILRAQCTAPEEMITGSTNRDFFFNPQKAVDYGVAHSVAEFSLPHGCGMLHI